MHGSEDSERAIVEAANRFVLDVGRVLLERRRQAPKGFDEWVAKSCPFDSEMADRLMMAVVHRERFGNEAPEPWTALR